MEIFTISHDAKTIKGERLGYLTAICYMIPSQRLCPFMSVECHKLCLRESGHLQFESTKIAARAKVALYETDLAEFKRLARQGLDKLVRKAKKRNLNPACRFNGTSDIYAHKFFRDIMDDYPTVQFYDYTKRPPQSWGTLPSNYHLTFSLSEDNLDHALKALDLGFNVAVPFHGIVPTTYLGRPVISGDDTDLRFLDAAPRVNDGKGVIVGLTAKGIARKAPYGQDHFIK